MKKLYDQNELLFAILWIVVYVVGFSTADGVSELTGLQQIVTLPVGCALAAVLYGFLRRHALTGHYGLCRPTARPHRLVWYVPLIAISSVNLWNGLALTCTVPQAVIHVLCMCLVAFLEEVIFRGLLFRSMARNGLRSAIIVSSVTFGMGHIVNMLSGAPLVETLLQLVYAAAIGFCYTAVFLTGGSLVPCILSHAVVNGMSVFAVQPDLPQLIITAAVQTIVSLLYGGWLLRTLAKTSDKA